MIIRPDISVRRYEPTESQMKTNNKGRFNYFPFIPVIPPPFSLAVAEQITEYTQIIAIAINKWTIKFIKLCSFIEMMMRNNLGKTKYIVKQSNIIL